MRHNNKRNHLWWQLPFLLLLIIGSIFIIRQNYAATDNGNGQEITTLQYQHDEGFIFGTVYSVTYQYKQDLKKEIEAELMKVDDALSTFNKHSIISKINRNDNVPVNDMFRQVFMLSKNISAETDGAFDITVAPLVNAWGFGFKGNRNKQPQTEKIDSLLNIIGFQKVSLQNNYIQKANPRIMLDCSAIAKGYGSDCIARLFKKLGIKNFMIEIGGEIVTKGKNPNKMPWKIGITKPTDDSLASKNDLEAVLEITDIAMATSGNYRNFYYKGGKKFAHTIDPKTGYPVQHSLLSATVLATNCATADGYATAFMVLGLEKAKSVLKRHPELLAYFIYSEDHGQLQIWHSQALAKNICK